jgi:aryl-alcohol dehydrogenase-like predicted oxidoreductase
MRSRLVRLGASDLEVPCIAAGTWAFGDQRMFRYGIDVTPSDVVDTFVESVSRGLTFFDTAEVYGNGESEKILGFLAQKHGRPLTLATKFALLPGRDGARAIRAALDGSLRRLRVRSVELYQVHWPDRTMATVDELMDAMADLVAEGKVRAVGVSNFGAEETRRAADSLAKRGIPLASNQVRYNLLHRAPEDDGVLQACRDVGATLLAYSPLEQGVLTGKYDATRLPLGGRSRQPWFSPEHLDRAAPLVARMREMGEAHGGVGPSVVALAWLLSRPGVIPVAGATRPLQAEENARALDVVLGDDELAELDALSRAVSSGSRVHSSE